MEVRDQALPDRFTTGEDSKSLTEQKLGQFHSRAEHFGWDKSIAPALIRIL
jgi:hypothetical protein